MLNVSMVIILMKTKFKMKKNALINALLTVNFANKNNSVTNVRMVIVYKIMEHLMNVFLISLLIKKIALI